MKRLFFFATLFILLFNSCEKEKDLVYEDYQSSTLLRQIGTSEIDMQIITYYNTGKVFEHLLRFGYNKYIYNDQNQLDRINIAMALNPLSCAIIPGASFDEGDDPRKAKIGQYSDFKYSKEGVLERTNHYYINDDTPQLMSYEVFVFQNEEVVRINMFNPQDELTQYRTYLYDDKGNVLEEEYHFLMIDAEASLQSRTIFEYDDKINPFQVFSVTGGPGRYSNKNNITKQITYNTGEEQPYVQENTYEYNDLGYPVKVNNVDYIYGEDQ